MNTKDEQAHARSSDPITSHQAAASVDDLPAKQKAVFRTLEAFKDGLTDEEMIADYKEVTAGNSNIELWPDQSESGLRTRRSELVAKGLVVDSGRRSKTKAGRSAIIWRVK